MEDQELDPNTEYLKGFNEGYALAQLMPDRAQEIIDAMSRNKERQEGMIGGLAQYGREQEKDLHLDWETNYDRDDQEPTREKDKHVDKDDYEPDRE